MKTRETNDPATEEVAFEHLAAQTHANATAAFGLP